MSLPLLLCFSIPFISYVFFDHNLFLFYLFFFMQSNNSFVAKDKQNPSSVQHKDSRE